MKQKKPNEKPSKFAQEMMSESKSPQIANDEVVKFFIPIAVKRRGGSAMVILPKNIRADDMTKCFDEKMIRAFAKAYKWRDMLDSGKIASLAAIALKEKVTTGYVSKVFNLNFIAPEIVEHILNGTQPRSLKLQDIVTGEIPDLWQEQKEMWGF